MVHASSHQNDWPRQGKAKASSRPTAGRAAHGGAPAPALRAGGRGRPGRESSQDQAAPNAAIAAPARTKRGRTARREERTEDGSWMPPRAKAAAGPRSQPSSSAAGAQDAAAAAAERDRPSAISGVW